jgi:hypothetical protein
MTAVSLPTPVDGQPHSAEAAWDRVTCVLTKEMIGSPAPSAALKPRYASHKPPTHFKTHTVVPGKCFSRVAHDLLSEATQLRFATSA